jgi:F0F1-type ATP synthase delta subunit
MKTPRSRISSTIADKTLKSGSTKAYAREVAAYLLGEKRTGDLDSIMRDVQADWAEHGRVEAIVRSAHPLTTGAKADITKRVKALYPSAKTVIVTDVLDPTVLGGVEIRVANRVLDLSVEAKLNKFKQLTGAGKE